MTQILEEKLLFCAKSVSILNLYGILGYLIVVPISIVVCTVVLIRKSNFSGGVNDENTGCLNMVKFLHRLILMAMIQIQFIIIC